MFMYVIYKIGFIWIELRIVMLIFILRGFVVYVFVYLGIVIYLIDYDFFVMF